MTERSNDVLNSLKRFVIVVIWYKMPVSEVTLTITVFVRKYTKSMVPRYV